MRLTGLNVHPLKSAAVRPVSSTSVQPQGLVDDRSWMVVDADGVRALLLSAGGRTDGEGIFVAGENGHGETLLFYAPNTTYPEAGSIMLLANLGQGVDPQALDVTNMILG